MSAEISRLDSRTLAYIYTLVQAAAMSADWKVGLDRLLVALRAEFVFDNIAVYLIDQETQLLEVLHARAVGRGKNAEADAAWGELIASRVVEREQIILQMPNELQANNQQLKDKRLRQAHLLGLPLYIRSRVLGAIVFVRFGGPPYEEEHVMLARLAEHWISYLVERKLAQQVQGQLDALQHKVRLQDDFVATISHELRTPLGFIKGYSTTLLRDDTSWDEETRREFLTIIDEEADHLARLIDNILESAKLQSSSLQINFQPIRLDAIIRDVTHRIRSRNPDLDIELDFSAIPPIQGDNVRLTQVFENLFSNAIKYAKGGKITISVKMEKGFALATFSDQGEGIPEAYLPYIFERFYRVPGEKSVTGSGLGLYICNQIITAHRGKIWVESEIDKGTTFFIRLPVDPTQGN